MISPHTFRIARQLLLVAATLLLSSGCQALLRPSQKERIASAATVLAELQLTREAVLRPTFLTFAADEDPKPVFESKDGAFQLHMTMPTIAGFGVAVDRDGYVLTAAHVLRKHTYIIGFMGGEVRIAKAKVVEDWKAHRIGEEYALIRVEAVLDYPVSLAAAEPGQRVVAVGRAPSLAEFQLLGGSIREVRPAPEAGRGHLIVAQLPVWYGDSGGPVFTAGGQVVGIATGFWAGWRAGWPRYERYVYAPDARELQRVIEQNKARDRGTLVAR